MVLIELNSFYMKPIALPVILFALLLRAGVTEAKTSPQELVWTEIRTLNVEGRGWNDTKDFFDRLPAKAEKMVRAPVWTLSHQSAGMLVRFVTGATRIHARWALTSPNLAMPHMAATGVSGIDLYVRTPEAKWRWLAVGQPTSQTNAVELVSGLPPGQREYLLYLPLYNGTKFVELGIPQGESIQKADEWGPGHRKPIVFYGTSILQGACASRPGMAYCALLGRHLNWPTINLGFSGNGKMELDLAELLAELDPAVYVLDCLPNMTVENTRERVEPFVRRLRQTHPDTPIVLVEDRIFANAFMWPAVKKYHEDQHRELHAAFERLKESKVEALYYVKGDHLFGDDGEATVDGCHPSDVGFMRQADVLVPVLKPLLKP